jgi:predicted RNA binding protein YcfA (HicA-like mRNA interferase family)
VKRKDILRKLAEAGYRFAEGRHHTRCYDVADAYRTVIGRHTDIPEMVVRKIEKQTGVKLL